MPTVYHFDIPVDDANRAQQFYKNVFGWDMKKVESQVDPKVELWMCETEDENGKKGVTGGMMKRDTLPTITNYVLVNSIDEYIFKNKYIRWQSYHTEDRNTKCGVLCNVFG
jgi:uncharacterized protein